MHKSFFALAFCGAISACAGTQTATGEGAQTASGTQATKRVCEVVEEDATGSHLPTTVCRTVPAESETSPTP